MHCLLLPLLFRLIYRTFLFEIFLTFKVLLASSIIASFILQKSHNYFIVLPNYLCVACRSTALWWVCGWA
jgi:hypothetical protein